MWGWILSEFYLINPLCLYLNYFFLDTKFNFMPSHLVKDAGFFLFLRENGVLHSLLPAETRANRGLQQRAENCFLCVCLGCWPWESRTAFPLSRNLYQKYFLWNTNKWGLQACESVSTELVVWASILFLWQCWFNKLKELPVQVGSPMKMAADCKGWGSGAGLPYQSLCVQRVMRRCLYRPLISLPRFGWDIVTHAVTLLHETAECRTLMKKHSN